MFFFYLIFNKTLFKKANIINLLKKNFIFYLQVSPSSRILFVDLIHSIILNVGGKYNYFFNGFIAEIFLSAFIGTNTIGHFHLYKMREQWNSIFSENILDMIDEEAHKVEPAWPYCPKTKNQNEVERELKLVTKQCEQLTHEIQHLEAAIKKQKSSEIIKEDWEYYPIPINRNYLERKRETVIMSNKNQQLEAAVKSSVNIPEVSATKKMPVLNNSKETFHKNEWSRSNESYTMNRKNKRKLQNEFKLKW